jgi:DNA-binding SARP family transcriptional activator
MVVELSLLGACRLRRRVGGTARDIHLQPKRFALLAYLGLAAGRGLCRRDTLLALLWSNFEEQHARNALNQAVHALRRVVGGGSVITRGHDELGVSSHRVRCDAAEFEKACASGRYEDALALYQGPLLEGLHVSDARGFEDWLTTERERLRVLAAEAASELSRREQRLGHTSGTLRWLRRLLDLSPDDEAALRRLMALRQTSGDAAGALHEYAAFERRLSEVDVDPLRKRACSPSIRKAHRRPHWGIVRTAPPTTTGGVWCI